MVNNTRLIFALVLFAVILGTVSAVSANDSINQTGEDLQISLPDSDEIHLDEEDVLSDGDDDFEEDNVNKKLSLSQTGGFYGETKLQVSLSNLDTGEGLGDEQIYFYVNHNFWKVLNTDSNGKININFNKNPGNYFVEAKYDDSDEIKSTVFFAISGIPTYISLKQTGAYYKDTKLTLTLTHNYNGKPLSDEQLDLKFSNGKSVSVKTNSKGVATYDVPFAQGQYSVVAKTHSSYINKNQVKLNFVIAKTYLAFTPTKLSTTYGSGKCFKVKVTNKFTKHAMAGVKISLKVYTGKTSKTVKLTTDSAGIAKYDTSSLSVGTHNVIVNNANSNMVGYEKSSSIKISKAALNIQAPKVTKQYKAANSFKLTVKNKESGKAMKNIKVTVKVWTNTKYKTYNLKTNSKGTVSIDTKSLSRATHKVNIIIKADSNVKSKSATSSITIKDKTNLENLNTTFSYDELGLNNGVFIYPKLTDGSGNVLIKGIIISTSANQTFSGISGDAIFLPNDEDSSFVPINNTGYVVIKFLGDNQYFGCQSTVNF